MPADTAAILEAPRWHPKWPKIGPRRLPDGLQELFSMLKIVFKNLLEPSWADLGPIWAPSWGHFRHFWRPSWAKIGPKRVLEAFQLQKREFSRNITFSNTKTLFLTPRWHPKWPKIGPRRLQEALEEQLFRS